MIFAKGTDFPFMQDHEGKRNFDGFNDTKRAEELYNEMMQSIEFGDKSTTCCGQLIFWSDAFQKCFSRQR